MLQIGDRISSPLSDHADYIHVLSSVNRLIVVKEKDARRVHMAPGTLYDVVVVVSRAGDWTVRGVLGSDLELDEALRTYDAWSTRVAPGNVMSPERRKVLAKLANAAHIGGTPLLDFQSSRESILEWLQTNDRNGSYLDWMQDEPEDRVSMEGAWDLLADVFEEELREVEKRAKASTHPPKYVGGDLDELAESKFRAGVRPGRSAFYPSLDIQVVRTMYGHQGWDLRLTWRVPDRRTDTSNWGGDFTRARALEVGRDVARKQSIANLDPRNPNPVRLLDEQGRCVAAFHAGKEMPCPEGIIRRLVRGLRSR